MCELFDNFEAGRFFVRGVALCHDLTDEIDPAPADLAISLPHDACLGVSRKGPGERSYVFDIFTRQSLRCVLPRPVGGTAETSFQFEGEFLGRVGHVTGREAGDAPWKGETSQLIQSLAGSSLISEAGLRLRLDGPLATIGWIGGRPTDPGLVRDRFLIDLLVPWKTLRFLFDPLTVQVWFNLFGQPARSE